MSSSRPHYTPTSGSTEIKYKMHWHVLLVHFPIASFLGSFTFMSLHLLAKNSCFDLAAYVSLIAGAIVMLPTTMTGWITWKHRYKGFTGKLFLNKIRISFGMIFLSIVLVIYQTVYPFDFLDVRNRLNHTLYFGGVTLLMMGAAAEGYYGGRLHHR
ncbi:MAG: hypothetical protein A2074_06090 [Candidatus Aquicultor primus]|uniref:DUF2231 domain-containing protein n=1 Tax=Candidatus Aquicultor primus TaxID=1797195 RepID=A0A1F2US24_9ACTN|nr:MAG: hypothetical protein A2074_06090 [Candidatus Aquicultor primus]HCG99780.1 hypothetical protein [Actinomycetota bacterium]